MFLAVLQLITRRNFRRWFTRTVLKLPSVLAPTKAAVLPLVKKDGLPEVSKKSSKI
jgi:glycyl-tRNA synthetase